MSDFWARRKAAVAAEDEADAAARDAAARAELAVAQADVPDADLLAELDLPDPDTLGDGDDFRPFLADAVPARLKTRALRRLWRVNPVLANLDGLVDYGEDFTDAATVVEALATSYQVGRGMAAHVEALASQAEADTTGADEAPRATDPQQPAGDSVAEDAPVADLTTPAPTTPAPTTPDLTGHEPFEPTPTFDDMPVAPARRRLRIVFDNYPEETA